MRQKLNENPVAQIGVVVVLLLIVGIFLMKSMGGGEETAEATAPATEESTSIAAAEEAAASLQGSAPAAATSAITAPAPRSLPDAVDAAYERGETVVLLIYRSGGIDDSRVAEASEAVGEMPGVALFTVPTREISHYALITGPLGVNQAPALIVVRPRALNGSAPAPATVDYGFRSASDIRQAVIDAGYHGPHLTYAPN
jgi:hypothetical protein